MKASPDELADSIAAFLGSPKLRDDVNNFIKTAQDILSNNLVLPPTKKECERLARGGLKWISDAEEWLNKTRGTNFFWPLFVHPDAPGDIDDTPVVALRNALSVVEAYCRWVLSSGYGHHGNTDQPAIVVAICARHLCLLAGRPVEWWDEGGAFRVVSGLMYEAVTGKEATGMERTCRAIVDRLAEPTTTH
jgi:hypothetical protein